ncbi:tetrapyrrole-binding protein, chloroplastic [Ricinus communis]|uniref:Tetrapyrrole-binding protein, chloroplast, putative n=1 Tax=Ricinus communis TaxID=3988 RepID=B9T5C4_RICCO|nr:tetrapyrrole-binding protein, chloroplastic [Ricinus communis]EEF28939.1 Tetrapyrrole-binding protein, chloroplast precursor, putative [Ricinus communis]|eukprot:XP_002533443.1 tetrapyrrole-binding protein, chloroplastic [Ricinus communis]
MATNSLQSLHHNHHSLLKLQHSDTTTPSSLFLKPTTTNTSLSLSISSSSTTTPTTTTTFSISPTTSTTPSTSQTFSLDLLQQHLSAQNFRQADEETRRLLIVLAGEATQKRGYVFFSEVQFISENDLKAIDELWKKYSNNKFGYSIQKRIWQQKANKDFTKFFIKVGWMKKLDTEVEQYNYRSFPTEFIWELNDEIPEGHLPLTNALRGTQLLNCILTHPAFDVEEEGEEEEDKIDDGNGGLKGLMGSKPLSKSVFKPDYSF